MKAKVIKDSFYTPNLQVGEVVEIIPGMETDAAGIWNAPLGKVFLCKKSDGTLEYELPTNLQIIFDEKPKNKIPFEVLEAAVKPAHDFLRKNYHPHTVIVIDYDGAHVYEASMGIPKLNPDEE